MPPWSCSPPPSSLPRPARPGGPSCCCTDLRSRPQLGGDRARSVARRPESAAALVDLRLHGDSPAFDPPHTVAACADDVRDLIARPDGWPAPADVVVGHSFGGKVALSLLADGPAPPLSQVWIVDSTPAAGEPEGTAWQMLGVARGLPQRVATRNEAVDGLPAGGIAADVAAWMASNLRRDGDGLVWALDWDAMEALLRDFFVRDLWPSSRRRRRASRCTSSRRRSRRACARTPVRGSRPPAARPAASTCTGSKAGTGCTPTTRRRSRRCWLTGCTARLVIGSPSRP